MPSHIFRMRSFFFLSIVGATLFFAGVFSEYRAQAADGPAPQEQAASILQASGVTGGLVIHIGCGDGRLTAALHAGDQYLVHGLAFDAQDVEQARKTILATGDYGPVSVDQFDGLHLPYIDGLANLIVAEEPDDDLAAEAMRVLAPGGVAYLKRNGTWIKTIKPRPDNIDDWTHFLHDSSGNAVAHDDVVGPPRRLQWVGSPRWSRHHDRMSSLSAMVSTGGRIFYIMDEGSRTSIQLPAKWTVIARDAFNGTVLWKKPISHWSQHLWPLKSGPTQLARRLVAVDDTVYVTLGVKAPLSALVASSGKTLRRYANSDGTEEVILHDGVLFLLVNKGSAELDNFKPKLNVGDQARVREEYHWNEQARQVMAYDAASGRHLWTVKTRVAPLTLSADKEGVFFHDGEKVVCLQRATGKEVWSSPPVARRQAITMNFGPKLVIYHGVAFFAGGDRKMTAFDAASGKKLWTAPHAQSGYQSPEDLLISGGLVWNAPTTSTRDTGIFTGRDPRTGEIKEEFPPNVDTYWFHHRCYIAKATDRFLLPSRTGIEFVDTKKKDWNINHWVRGSCMYGIMPCNGLVYAPPHNCACYPEAKLFGLNALAPQRTKPYERPDAGPRLEPGPAFSDPLPLAEKLPLAKKKANAADWPTYRGNDARSGYTPTKVSAHLKTGWKTTLGGKLSSVVVADGKLFVAQVDAHTVHALDAQTGKQVWSKTVGGRVDSPPTISRGRAFFGAADGYVYCLRAEDGVLIWRFRAAPYDMRLPSYEQLESVWPVHGSLLVKGDFVYAVAGRSNFLDGGLRVLKLDIQYGKLLAETHMDENDPATGKNIQSRLQVLNMPVGLPDILSSNGDSIFMRSQKFDGEARREGLGPHSGSPAEQGYVQRGDEAHLFAPLGFLDDSMFHRSYWVYGRSFAGGHSGYYQAGKYAPSGRILVFDEKNVYGFGRKANYYRWTTILEHQLFSAPKEAPQAPAPVAKPRKKGRATFVNVANSKSLNPSNQEISAIAWATSDKPNGVILAHGGPADGYALFLRQGKPQFAVRSNNKLTTIGAAKKQQGKWFHVAGVLSEDKTMRLYVNGKLVASGKAAALVSRQPAQALQIGADDGSAVGNYQSPNGLTGKVDEVRIHHRALSAKEIAARYQAEVDGRPAPKNAALRNAALALAMSFDKGKAADASPNDNRGVVQGARVTSGKIGGGLRFVRGRSAPPTPNSYVKHNWAQDEPLFIRAMVKAGDTLFIAGPADIINEETSFKKLTEGDPEIQVQLAKQDEIMSGKYGSLLHAVSAVDGRKIGQFKLPSAPVWDGMAAAAGRIYLTTVDGQVLCLQAE